MHDIVGIIYAAGWCEMESLWAGTRSHVTVCYPPCLINHCTTELWTIASFFLAVKNHDMTHNIIQSAVPSIVQKCWRSSYLHRFVGIIVQIRWLPFFYRL
jgi:hypothetical protein